MDTVLGRLRTNAGNPIMRRNVVLLMAGKMIGLAIVLFAMHELMPSVAHA